MVEGRIANGHATGQVEHFECGHGVADRRGELRNSSIRDSIVLRQVQLNQVWGVLDHVPEGHVAYVDAGQFQGPEVAEPGPVGVVVGRRVRRRRQHVAQGRVAHAGHKAQVELGQRGRHHVAAAQRGHATP